MYSYSTNQVKTTAWSPKKFFPWGTNNTKFFKRNLPRDVATTKAILATSTDLTVEIVRVACRCSLIVVTYHHGLKDAFTYRWRTLSHLIGQLPVGTGNEDHNDVIKWKHFRRYLSFVRGIHRSPVNRDAGDLKDHRTHCDVTVIWFYYLNIITRPVKTEPRLDAKLMLWMWIPFFLRNCLSCDTFKKYSLSILIHIHVLKVSRRENNETDVFITMHTITI